MKEGGYRKAVSSGFTIVETLIVLAVSSILVISAVALVSGRANKTQFMTASNDLRQQIQQVVNEAGSGYFPNSGHFSCASPAIPGSPILANGSRTQGTNGDCVFLGKVIQFGAYDQPDKMLVYAIAGNRLQAGTSNEVTSLAQSFPVAVAPGNSNNSSLTGITLSNPLQNGLAIKSLKYASGDITGFGFLSTLATISTSCNGVCSGSQQLGLYAITGGTAVNQTTNRSKDFVDVLDASAGNYVATSQVTACFDSGTTNQSVVYTIGSNGNGMGVDMQIQSGSCT
jgi:type II secretory pathway pseudopilin PulG